MAAAIAPMTRPALLIQSLLALLICLSPSAMRSPAASQSLLWQRPGPGGTAVSYVQSDEAFNNPERGYYQQVDCSSGPLDVERLRSYRGVRHQTLIMCAFILSGALGGPIDEPTLRLLQHQMDSVRLAGMKMVLRFAYNYSDNAQDAGPNLMLAHLEQLRPYLTRNSDVIAVVQAGLIGSWGEWAKSRHFGSGELSEENWRDRKRVFGKLLDVVPATRMVQLRTPDFKYRLAGAGPLSSTDAFRNTARARTGHHNDCFLASDNDWGTYRRMSPAGQNYLQADTAYVAMGGETCNYNPPRTDCDSALREMARFHWSYLNSQYHEEVLDAWRGQGCDAEVEQRLGYRISLVQGNFDHAAAPGGSLHLQLTLRNAGWAAPYNPRAVELVLRNRENGAVYRMPLNAEPRFWLPGRSIVLRQTVTLPQSLPPGDYALLLNLPDPAASLQARSDYAIRLANANIWEAATGYNQLGASVQVTPL